MILFIVAPTALVMPPRVILVPGKNQGSLRFISATGKCISFSAPWMRKTPMYDFLLLKESGLTLISRGGQTFLWNPFDGKLQTIQDQMLQFFYGFDFKLNQPCMMNNLKRSNPLFNGLPHYGTWTGTINKYNFEKVGRPFNEVVRRSLWPSIPDADFGPYQGHEDYFYAPFFRRSWIAFKPQRHVLSWVDHKIEFDGKVVKTLSKDVMLNAISGNNDWGTVSIVVNENKDLRHRDGTRDAWDDSVKHGSKREIYYTYYIDMHDGSIVDVHAGEARVEFCRRPV